MPPSTYVLPVTQTEVDDAVRVEALTRRFAGVTAVDGLRFRVGTAEIFGLVGPDGAGKTTTLRMLAGVLPPDSGSASVAGCDVVREAELLKTRISYMPQRFGLYEDLTVDENIRFYADLFETGRKAREERAARLLAASGMSEFRQRLAGQLSGGMKQKLGLTCALIHTPRVLLLDEPTTGVDPVSRRDFWRILYWLVDEGVTVVISTSYLDEAERCHRLALLRSGHLLLCDTPANLKRRMRGEVVVATSSQPREVRDALAGAPGVLGSLLVGVAVHLNVDAAARIPELQRALVAAGVPCDSMLRVEPTMEDLFVSAVREAEGAGA
jgi:ABC-2 type transport system ATP-binding protein